MDYWCDRLFMMKRLLMIQLDKKKHTINILISKKLTQQTETFIERFALSIMLCILTIVSIACFIYYYQNGLGLSYNDARSHLDIGRRVVEGLKPGLAQLGSVWLPLPHILMVPTIWDDFMWHSGLAGAIQSMISYIATGLLIYLFLQRLGVGLTGRLVGVFVFAVNLNVLYLQSTAMTELLLLATMTAGVYELMNWHREEKLLQLVSASFWIMLTTLIRYDGWFLLFFASMLVVLHAVKKYGLKAGEGMFIFFVTLGGLGIILWILWNQLIFNDALYFIFGPYSARAQQKQLESAGVLITHGDWYQSIKIYFYALFYNSNAFISLIGLLGGIVLWFDKNIKSAIRIATTALFAPLLFNILALYLGHSVLFIQGLSGDTWFNARYGLMMMPSIAIFTGYVIERYRTIRNLLIGLILFTTVFMFTSYDAVTIDDARVGSSQKNVSEVSGYLNKNAGREKGFILISAASHDAIIFSSGLPMKRFIHEGTGAYWESATTTPDRWARWIVMRTNDENDITFKAIKKTPGYLRYTKVASYPFADVYELQNQYRDNLITEPILGKQR